ncbi:MAG: hypothetical protein Q3983_04025 [Capnocytophaga sp.]|nr:hypothetical protein [Capnocytophaga sp.]
MKKFVILTTALIMLSACRTTKTDVGQFRENPGKDYVYAKGKQVWIFWGLLPAGRTKVNTPSSGNCQVITRTNLADLLISGLTAGIVSTETIKIKAKQENAPQQQAQPQNTGNTTIQIHNHSN